jgi:tetratricopeptide (TPR) repeat protein
VEEVMLLTFVLVSTLSLGSTSEQSTAAAALQTARDQYAAASYREALDTLSKADGDQAAPAVYEYQALCLLALGRKDEAVSAFAKLIERDPMFRADRDDLAPSVRDLFETVRRETLPKAARRQFAKAREAFEQNDYRTAVDGFAQVGRVLDEMDTMKLQTEDASDLRMLAAGFVDLAQSRLRLTVEHPATAVTPMAAPLIGSKARRVVVPAMPLERSIPGWPSTLPRPVLMTATITITIDATGAVTGAQLAAPINPTYDAMLKSAALAWRYQPATLDGRPTESTQVIRLDLPR